MQDKMKFQLFMLHFSGGSVYSFKLFNDSLQDFFTLEPLELPGRGLRFHEDLINDKEAAINDLMYQIKAKRNNLPFIIYGHSLGAELGFLITKELEKTGDHPHYLVVSGNPGPNLRDDEKLYDLPNPLFFEKLKDLGGLSEEILNNSELLEVFEPILRADFEIIEKDINTIPSEKINTPIYAIMGDEEKKSNQISNWKNYTGNSFDFQVLKGNHFFIYENKEIVCNVLILCQSMYYKIPQK